MNDGTINLQLLSVCKCNILELWNVFVVTLKIFQALECICCKPGNEQWYN